MTAAQRRWFVAFMVGGLGLQGIACGAHTSRPRTLPDTVIMPSESGTFDVALHPSYMTVLFFPGNLTRVVTSDPKQFSVEAVGKEGRVHIRPSPTARTGNLSVATERVRINVRLHVVESADDAALQRSFVMKPAAPEGAPRDQPESLTAESSSGRQPSLSIHGIYGRAELGDTTAGAQLDETVIAGIAAQLTLGRGRWHAYEATLSFAQTGRTYFEHAEHGAHEGTMVRYNLLARALGGVSVSAGRRFIPSMRIGGGIQARGLLTGQLELMDDRRVQGPPAEIMWDAVVGVGVGLDWRLGSKLTMGVRVNTVRTVMLGDIIGKSGDGTPFNSLEGALNVGWF